MNSFKSNIINIYGESGQAWLDDLPKLIDSMAKHYNLLNLTALSNLSHNNYILSGFCDKQPIILKLGPDKESLEREALALQSFANLGAIKLLGASPHALLLEHAWPGKSLQAYFPERDEEAIAITCQLIRRLHQAALPNSPTLPSLKDWLATLDKSWDIPQIYLQQARKLRDNLLVTANKPVLLHGDLHHGNILQNGSGWLVIDPKGIIGEAAYEVTAFIRNPIPELLDSPGAKEMIRQRLHSFATLLNLPPERILSWCLVQAVLSWIWSLEDKTDSSYFRRLTEILFFKTPCIDITM